MQEGSCFPKSVSLPALPGSFTQKLPDLQLESLVKLPPIPGRWQCVSMRFQALGSLTEAGMISQSSKCTYPPPLHVCTHALMLSRMITGAARSYNSRPTDYIRRQAGRIVCTRIYRKTNTIELVTLLELHFQYISDIR